MSKSTPINVHGRQWGRGIRPYLLIPKVILVSGFLGGLLAALVLIYLPPAPETLGEWQAHKVMVHRAFVYLIVPCLIGAMGMGLMLLSCHFSAFVRMRWFQVKFVLVAIFVPTMHTVMRGLTLKLGEAINTADFTQATVIRGQMKCGAMVTLGFALVILFLGRVKPRLWQNYGRTFARHPLPANDDNLAT